MGTKLGDTLKKLRKSKRLTQQTVADLLGVKKATVSHYENGRNEPDFVTLSKLADIYGVSLQHISISTYLQTPTPYPAEKHTSFLNEIINEIQGVAVRPSNENNHDLVREALHPYLGDDFSKEFLEMSREDQDEFLNDIRLLWQIRYAKRHRKSTSGEKGDRNE